MTGNGRSGEPSRAELKRALLEALRERGELDMNELTAVALVIRPAVPETPVGNVRDIVEALDELERDGTIIKTGESPRRYQAT